MNICQIVDEIKLVYCPAHKSIQDNYTADSLTKVASKKTKICLKVVKFQLPLTL